MPQPPLCEQREDVETSSTTAHGNEEFLFISKSSYLEIKGHTLWEPPTSEINTTTALPLEYSGLPSTTQIAIRPSRLASQTQAAISGKKA